MKRHALTIAAFLSGLLVAPVASADLFSFTTGSPDGLLGSASRPGSVNKIEIESADDFTTTAGATRLTNATFTGLITGTATLPAISQVAVEIYRIFPKDSNTARAIQVPSRVNSPSDVEFGNTGRDSLAGGGLTFSTTVLNSSFSAANSVLNGIFKSPNQTTLGEGAIRGLEVLFSVTFTTPIVLPPDHYFFVPQVELPTGDFFWLSATKTIGPPVDLQTWIRNGDADLGTGIAPDWLRIGTDVIGATAPAGGFNAAFTLAGVTPEPAAVLLLIPALLLLGRLQRREAVAQA